MSIGGIGGIDSSRIQAMMEQLKAAASKPAASPLAPAGPAGGVAQPAKLDFADALKSSLQEVSNTQKAAQELGQRFVMGDDTVSLSDTMIAMQKSSLAFQGTVQVRNKLVSAYHDIMNMQV
ncbi:flagellar hook-basal body complex protein FliE [Massilia oculi]|uniref:Flagellar hook-basal body complex protein FliE n=1 Tax=Massilia hydrophila TaxID=3044279 RepID=A0ABS7Y4S9_9BURK|nr:MULTISPECIES: flagellar hook-basal body complex protein FliE [Massilia]MCA1248651.1 flagellar hook-basal body complex protein FliE [Massilia sp. MS-15]MCA1854673.1 flagellar hook-basal body complex protein FliE [Massilia oculi]